MRRDVETYELVQEYADGLTLNQLATRHNMSKQGVHRRLTNAGVQIRNYRANAGPPRIALDVQGMVQSYASGMGLKAVAAKYGTNYDTARTRLREAGVTIRPKGRPRKSQAKTA